MKYKNIIFDLDSTLVTLEGLDFLAHCKGVGPELEKITALAMDGLLPQREAMRRKLGTIRPSIFDLVDLGREYVGNLVPGARELIAQFHREGYQVWIVTGNFHPAADIAAHFLGVPPEHVIANEVTFGPDGDYGSIDLDQPLINNHGKARVIKERGLVRAVMIGDGATDLETKPVVDLFIGFGGVVKRPKVEQGAQVYFDQPDIRGIISLLQ
jgi:phosphoserine phosphatase